MLIRSFRGDDAEALLLCWNNARSHDAVTRECFIKKLLLDVNFDAEGLLIAEEAGKILGFVNCVFRRVPMDAHSAINPREGWISAFAVDAPDGFEQVGNALMDAAESYFKTHGKTVISTGYYPLYLYQGMTLEYDGAYLPLFDQRGYSRALSLARELTLSEYTTPTDLESRRARLKENGIYTGAMEDKYIASLMDSREEFNSPSGAYEFKLRLLELDYGRIRIAAKDGHVIGVCVFGDPYDSPCRFGPFVVSPAYQGQGIGSVMLHDCLTEMKARGLERAWMQWTPRSGAAFAMYGKLGFRITKTYVTFSKRFEREV